MAAFTDVGVRAVVKDVNKFTRNIGKMGSAVTSVGKTIAKAAVTGVAAFGVAAAGVGVASLKAAIDFESAFAGVIKTTDGLVDEFGDLTESGEGVQQGFRDLAKEVPTAVEELLAIGELGGQLGIAREDLVDFTRTIAAMGEATNLSTEEAATGFAQIANIMQTPQDQIENMGSSIVALGNNFATTERDILTFAQRIAGAGAIAGLTEADVFAIGTAMSSVGVQAEAGGTAVQKVLLAMNEAVISNSEQLEIFAATAGLSASDFAAVWEEDAAGAFNQFVMGLGDAGDDALGILDALDLKDQRLTRAFLSLAGAGDLLTETMELSSEAFDDNTALAKEAQQRYKTTASQFKVFKNIIKDLGITIGQALLPFLQKLLVAAKPLLEDFAKKLPDFLENSLVPAIENVSNWFSAVLIPAVQEVVSWINENLIPVLITTVEWLATNIPIAIQMASDFWQNTLLPAITNVWEFFKEKILPILVEVFEFLSEIVPPIVEEVSTFIQDAFQGVVDWFQSNLPLIQETVQTVLTAIQNFWAEHGQRIVGIVIAAWEIVKAQIQLAIGIVQGIIETVMNLINGNWEAAWESIKELLRTAWLGIRGIIILQFRNIVDNILPILFAVLQNIWTAAWEVIKVALTDAWENLKLIIKSGLGVVRVLLRIGLDKAKVIWENVWNAVKDFFGGLWASITGIVAGAVDSIIGIIQGIIDKVKEALGFINDLLALRTATESDVEAARELPFGTSTEGLFPEGQSGGITRGGLLRTHPNEALIPLNQRGVGILANAMTQAMQSLPFAPGGSGSTVNNTTNITMNPTMSNQQSEASMFFDITAALEASRL